MAPGDQAYAPGRVVGLLAQGGDGVRRGQDGFEHHLDRDGRRGIERPGDFLRMDGHLFQGFRAVEMLTAGDEPDFELFEIGNFHNPKSHLVQFDRTSPGFHNGNGRSKKEYPKNSVYWCQSYDLVPSSVQAPKQESEVPKVPKMIGEVPVEPTIYFHFGKHYLKVDTSKHMMFSKTQNGFDATAHSIDFIGILPTGCCKRVVDASGHLYDTPIFILCPQEYLPPVEMTLAEIEKKLGHKVKVKV